MQKQLSLEDSVLKAGILRVARNLQIEKFFLLIAKNNL